MNETLTTVANAIRSHFDTEWDTDVASVTWENTPQDLTGNDPWVRVSIRFSVPNYNVIGSECIHRRGHLYVQCFTRYDVGTGYAEEVAEAVRALFEFEKVGDIQFYETELIHVGDSMRQLNHIESSWFQLVITVRFETL